jgi:hypothetical protein
LVPSTINVPTILCESHAPIRVWTDQKAFEKKINFTTGELGSLQLLHLFHSHIIRIKEAFGGSWSFPVLHETKGGKMKGKKASTSYWPATKTQTGVKAWK